MDILYGILIGLGIIGLCGLIAIGWDGTLWTTTKTETHTETRRIWADDDESDSA